MSYPPPEPPPTDPPLPPQQPYVPGAYLAGYRPPPGTYGYDNSPGVNSETYGYGYGTPPGATPEMYGYGYGAPPPYYPVYPYGYAPPRETEGLAIASLVVSCAAVLGICTWGVGGLLGIVGAVLGHVARRRIRLNGRNGDGMALAGIIVGWILAALGAAAIAVLIVLIAHDSSSTESI
jgi:hypothetical protein